MVGVSREVGSWKLAMVDVELALSTQRGDAVAAQAGRQGRGGKVTAVS